MGSSPDLTTVFKDLLPIEKYMPFMIIPGIDFSRAFDMCKRYPSCCRGANLIVGSFTASNQSDRF